MEELRELTRKLESNLPYLNVDFDRSSFTDMANSMMPKGYEPPSRIEWPTAEIKMMQITIKKIECFKPSDYVWEDIEKLMQKK
ncbi:MAG: hypothetical protein LIP09_10980 [Bacteroidales bacterium]|nr:hypothetical protein [Bacteroidales bacterium]